MILAYSAISVYEDEYSKILEENDNRRNCATLRTEN